MNFIAKYCANIFLSKGFIKENDYDWCIYGLSKRMTTISTLFVLIFIGGFLFGFCETLVFSICLLELRRCTNGYHAHTFVLCLILSLTSEIIGMYIASRLTVCISFFLLLISNTCVLLFAPRNDCKIHLSKSEIQTLRRRVHNRAFYTDTLFFIMVLFCPYLSNYIATAFLTDAIFLFFPLKQTEIELKGDSRL